MTRLGVRWVALGLAVGTMLGPAAEAAAGEVPAAPGGATTAPASPEPIAEPFVLSVFGTWTAYATNNPSAVSPSHSSTPVISSAGRGTATRCPACRRGRPRAKHGHPGSWPRRPVRKRGAYWLFYSSNEWNSRNRAIGVARCKSPIGSCARVHRTPVLRSRSPMAGPGGPTILRGPEGRLRLGFAAWTDPDIGYDAGGQRRLHTLRLSFASGQPAVG
jgi:hypothetical protein